MATKHHKIGTTYHAYQLIEVRITENNMKRLIENVRRYGKGLKDDCLSEGIKKFVSFVRGRYRATNDSPDYTQQYLVYGMNLYIFNRDVTKLITVYELPKCYHEEARKLKEQLRGKKKEKINFYDRPLTKPKKKRKQKHKKTK